MTDPALTQLIADAQAAAGATQALLTGLQGYAAGQTSTPPVTPPPVTVPPVTTPPVTTGRPFFAKADWLWAPIPASPVLDPKSAAAVAELAQGQHKLAIIDFGVTIRTATASTPRAMVTFSESWGSNPHLGQPMPIPADFPIPPGGYGAVDGHTVVIDPIKGLVWSEWMATNGGKGAAWGSVVDINGDGTEPGSMTSTGSKLSRLAGVITQAEMAAGVIPHALFMSCKNVGAGFRYPAGKTDQSGSEATQEGMRFQLDPSLDLSNLSKPARIVAKAMQDYGIYVGDGGGAGATIICEYPGSQLGAGYKSAGVTGDFMGIDDIPWSKCRVLRQWDGK